MAIQPDSPKRPWTAQLHEPARKKQKPNNPKRIPQTTIDTLFGDVLTNHILPLFEAKELGRMEQTCSAIRDCCQEVKDRRLQALSRLKISTDLLASFGIVCRNGMFAAVGERVKAINDSLPESMRERSARDLLDHPDGLGNFLQNAYNYSLLQTFRTLAKVQEDMSLDEGVQQIRERLKSGKLPDPKRLDLESHHLSCVPLELCQCTNLRELNLRDNNISVIPSKIGQLTNLEYLDLSRNRLTSLPAKICRLERLQQLNLSSNRLTSVSGEIEQLTDLQELDVQDNPLSTISARIGNMPNLKILTSETSEQTART